MHAPAEASPVFCSVDWLEACAFNEMWARVGAGLTVPIERKAEIYAICAEFDVIIVEDDPYWYLQFGRSAPPPQACI